MSLNLLSGSKKLNIDILDWDQLHPQISSNAYFDYTKKIISIPPTPKKTKRITFEHDAIEQFLTEIDLYQDLLYQNLSKLPCEENHHDIIHSIKKNKVLSIQELNATCSTIESYKQIQKSFKSFKYVNNLYIDDRKLSNISKFFARPLRLLIKESGEINYEGHPELRKQKRELHTLEANLRSDLQKITKSDLYRNALQFNAFDIVGDHYVLAVKSDNYQYNHGPIIDKSSSGQTLFVEPFELRHKCDKRIRIMAKIDEILSKICIKYSEILCPFSHEIENALEVLQRLDLLNSKASYCYRKNLTRPTLTQDFEIEMKNFFHPLIDNPVPNTINISKEQDGLIISGPNTGGKTVTLKSLAISQIFLHLGLYVPATQATLSPITNLYFLGNEGQDLSGGLSSFALESKNYLEILEHLGETNLIIVDEIFNSTSSEEASALALSLFEEFKKISNTKFLISTHHQLLKTAIHGNDSFLSAHVGFDLKTNLPTYKLYTDGPGSSLAFTIFENLSKQFSVPNTIASHAKRFLDTKQISYDELLQDLSTKKTEINHILNENRTLNHNLKNQKKAMEGVLFLEKVEAHKQYKKKLTQILDKAHELYSEVKTSTLISKKQFHKKESVIKTQFLQTKENAKEDKSLNEHPTGLKQIPFDQIKVHMNLYSLELKKQVLVTKLNLKKRIVHIKAGNMGLWSKYEDLYIHHGLLKKEKITVIQIEKVQKVALETDCRGMRLDEFQRVAEDCINDLLSENIPFAVLIHGHGSGILKKWLRDYLKNEFPEIVWSAPNGNDGHTELKLKE